MLNKRVILNSIEKNELFAWPTRPAIVEPPALLIIARWMGFDACLSRFESLVCAIYLDTEQMRGEEISSDDANARYSAEGACDNSRAEKARENVPGAFLLGGATAGDGGGSGWLFQLVADFGRSVSVVSTGGRSGCAGFDESDHHE
jgi:hypothetical protein